MKGWIRRTWVGCVVALASGASVAHAGGGVITFSGAVVAPTCAPEDGRTSTPNRANSRYYCEGSNAVGDEAQSFVLRVTTVRESGLADDRVLRYFAGYHREAGAEEASLRLVTQTFQ